MIKNYLMVTLRNLYKNRVYALINILGLGMALSICIVAYFNHMFGYDYDRWHENFKEIYRVNSMRDMQDRSQEYGSVPMPMGLDLKDGIPAVSNSARLMRSYSPVKVGIDNFNRQISYVDPAFLELFTFTPVAGNLGDLREPNNVLISESMATALYGNEEAIGRSVSIFNEANEEYTYTVAAVFEDLQQNSSFMIDILTHIDNYLTMWNVDQTDWKRFSRALFIQVPNPSDLPTVMEGLAQYIPVQNKANESFTINGFNIVPMKEVKNNTREIWNSALFPGLHPAALLAPLMMALTMLLIAAFNFLSLRKLND
jgi:putative ABC transport system permease protein